MSTDDVLRIYTPVHGSSSKESKHVNQKNVIPPEKEDKIPLDNKLDDLFKWQEYFTRVNHTLGVFDLILAIVSVEEFAKIQQLYKTLTRKICPAIGPPGAKHLCARCNALNALVHDEEQISRLDEVVDWRSVDRKSRRACIQDFDEVIRKSAGLLECEKLLMDILASKNHEIQYFVCKTFDNFIALKSWEQQKDNKPFHLQEIHDRLFQFENWACDYCDTYLKSNQLEKAKQWYLKCPNHPRMQQMSKFIFGEKSKTSNS
jgi:hypothetical protein